MLVLRPSECFLSACDSDNLVFTRSFISDGSNKRNRNSANDSVGVISLGRNWLYDTDDYDSDSDSDSDSGRRL